ncbi:MAG: GlsB/YeaQ/YmgE family stress response membrane protein [Clostridia bacterium]|nr:GlsB/YeaQ/YmgE family stress response membrane protein [Clostridia bacterium]
MHWLWQLIVSILIGALSGWIASKIMKTKGGFIRCLILGVLGGALGGWLGSLIGLGGGWISSIVLSVAGACIIILAAKFILKR